MLTGDSLNVPENRTGFPIVGMLHSGQLGRNQIIFSNEDILVMRCLKKPGDATQEFIAVIFERLPQTMRRIMPDNFRVNECAL
jgi:hypothetical protein